MSDFRNINYGRMLYETLRNYFSVNANGDLSILYKFLFACVIVLQQPFIDYDTFRRQAYLIATCKWQIGQLTNVLNYLYDDVQKRITITQNQVYPISDPVFNYPAINSDVVFGENTTAFERNFYDQDYQTIVTFNVPSSVNQSALIAMIEQVRLEGILYQINIV